MPSRPPAHAANARKAPPSIVGLPPPMDVVETRDYQPQWSTWTRQVVIVGLVIAAVYALTLLAPVMKLLTMTFLLSLVMFAPSRFLARVAHIPYTAAVALCYAVMISVAAIGIILFIPPAASSINDLRQNATARYTQLQDQLRDYQPEQGVVTILNLPVDLNPLIEPVRNLIAGDQTTGAPTPTSISTNDLQQALATISAALTPAVSGVTGFVSTALMALFVSFLVLLDLPNLEQALPGWIPTAYHRELSLLLHQVGAVWNGFFRGQLLIAFVLGALTWLQLMAMGIQNAATVAVFCGVVSLIPSIGGIIALVPIGLTALLQGSPVFPDWSNGTLALVVVLINLAISQVIWNVVAPRIMGDAVNLPLPIIIVGIFIGAALGGLLGAFLITPIIGTIRVVVIYLLKKIGRQDPYPGQVALGTLGYGLRKPLRAGSRVKSGAAWMSAAIRARRSRRAPKLTR